MPRPRQAIEAIADTQAELSWWSLLSNVFTGVIRLVEMFLSH